MLEEKPKEKTGVEREVERERGKITIGNPKRNRIQLERVGWLVGRFTR